MAQLIRKKETGGTFYDLRTTYGVRLVKGAYEELLRYPPIKDYVTNNSRVEHGVQYIATSTYAKYNEKQFSIRFILEASNAQFYSNLDTFLSFISSGMFELKITTLNKCFRLVYKDCERLETYRTKTAIFELKLIEPDPTDRSVPLT